MNGVIGMIELALEESLSDKVCDYLSTAKSSGNALIGIINDILDISKIEAGKMSVEIRDCCLNELLSNINSITQTKMAEKGVEFKTIFDCPVPRQIRSDPTRLRQCLVNLIGNASKFTKTGHIHVHVSVQNDEKDPNIRFDVEDTGIGIPHNKQEAIFDSFGQADGSTTRKFGGTGLGLTITKELAKLLGGSISLTSEPGKGSTFSLIIPAGVDIESQSLIAELERDTSNNERTKMSDIKLSGKILVAEDDKVNQMVIQAMLKKAGFQVTMANDGREAVEKACSESFDIILMDINMPNMNGCEATRALRKKGFTLPILALTASVLKSELDECIEAGCDEHLCKPIDRPKLFETLEKYLSSADDSVSNEIDDVKAQGEELNEEISEPASPEAPATEETENLSFENVIDWENLVDRIGDEELACEIAEAWLVSTPESIVTLSKAIKQKDAEQIRFLSHTLKGSSAAISAKPMSEAAHSLELAGKEGKLKEAGALYADVQAEYEKLKSFLSRANWVELAKQQDNCLESGKES